VRPCLALSDGAYTGYYLAAAFPVKVKKLIAMGAGILKKGWRNFTVILMCNCARALITD